MLCFSNHVFFPLVPINLCLVVYWTACYALITISKKDLPCPCAKQPPIYSIYAQGAFIRRSNIAAPKRIASFPPLNKKTIGTNSSRKSLSLSPSLSLFVLGRLLTGPSVRHESFLSLFFLSSPLCPKICRRLFRDWRFILGGIRQVQKVLEVLGTPAYILFIVFLLFFMCVRTPIPRRKQLRFAVCKSFAKSAAQHRKNFDSSCTFSHSLASFAHYHHHHAFPCCYSFYFFFFFVGFRSRLINRPAQQYIPFVHITHHQKRSHNHPPTPHHHTDSNRNGPLPPILPF